MSFIKPYNLSGGNRWKPFQEPIPVDTVWEIGLDDKNILIF